MKAAVAAALVECLAAALERAKAARRADRRWPSPRPELLAEDGEHEPASFFAAALPPGEQVPLDADGLPVKERP